MQYKAKCLYNDTKCSDRPMHEKNSLFGESALH